MSLIWFYEIVIDIDAEFFLLQIRFRDALIVTSLDMVTSFLAGITIFGILGNLAQETGKELKDVVQGGWDLAFITYPEAISKFKTLPQVRYFSRCIYRDIV